MINLPTTSAGAQQAIPLARDDFVDLSEQFPAAGHALRPWAASGGRPDHCTLSTLVC